MSFLGMDLESALNHARRLESNAANEIFNVLATMEGIIPQLMEAWKGEDAERFEREWMGHRSALRTAHGALNELVDSLNASVESQRRASGD